MPTWYSRSSMSNSAATSGPLSRPARGSGGCCCCCCCGGGPPPCRGVHCAAKLCQGWDCAPLAGWPAGLAGACRACAAAAACRRLRTACRLGVLLLGRERARRRPHRHAERWHRRRLWRSCRLRMRPPHAGRMRVWQAPRLATAHKGREVGAGVRPALLAAGANAGGSRRRRRLQLRRAVPLQAGRCLLLRVIRLRMRREAVADGCAAAIRAPDLAVRRRPLRQHRRGPPLAAHAKIACAAAAAAAPAWRLRHCRPGCPTAAREQGRAAACCLGAL